MLKSTKDSAVKARTQALNQMKALIVASPAPLCESLNASTTAALVSRCRGLWPGPLDGTTAAAKYTLRSLARRYQQLGKEIKDPEAEIQRPTVTVAPGPVGRFGIGPDTAATLLVAAGKQPPASPFGSCLRLSVRCESRSRFLRQDQLPSPQPRWSPPSQRGTLPLCDRQTAS